MTSTKQLVFERVQRNSVDSLEVSFPPQQPVTTGDTRFEMLQPRFVVTKANFSIAQLHQLRNIALKQGEPQSILDFITGILIGPNNTLH